MIAGFGNNNHNRMPMLSFLPAPVIGVLNSLLLGLNTVFWCLLLYTEVFGLNTLCVIYGNL